jgi:hypothetical protein
MRVSYASSVHRYHLVRTLRLPDPLPTDACSLKVTANLISAAAAWVKAERPRQVAFVLEHECDDSTSKNMSFGMLEGRDAGLAQLLRGILDDAGQASPFLFVLRSFPKDLLTSFVDRRQFTRRAFVAPPKAFARCYLSLTTSIPAES